jgi:hypothetical protein
MILDDEILFTPRSRINLFSNFEICPNLIGFVNLT